VKIFRLPFSLLVEAKHFRLFFSYHQNTIIGAPRRLIYKLKI